MKTTLKYLYLIVVLLFALSACVPGQKVTVLDGDERDSVLVYSEDMAENLLTAINTGDYAAFSRDMSESTAKAMNENEFKKIQDLLASKTGAYQSREVDRVEKIGDSNYAVTYKAKYDKEDAVTVRLVFSGSDPHQVIGLWFDSPNLRKK